MLPRPLRLLLLMLLLDLHSAAAGDASTTACENSCFAASDGECDDGGDGSLFAVCARGSDCLDCGLRHIQVPAPASPPSTASPSASVAARCADHCYAANDGECDDGGDGAVWAVCEHGSDCADCGYRSLPELVAACSDGCLHSSDGECDDGGDGSAYALCELGSDCADCGHRPLLSPAAPPPPLSVPPGDGTTAVPPGHIILCDDSCSHTSDGECDDGGAGSAYALCGEGADCTDCGHRVALAGALPLATTIVSSAEPDAVRFKLLSHGVECASANDRLGHFAELAHCAEACANSPGCRFFIYGTASEAGECWAEITRSPSCPEGFESAAYDFFALHAASVNGGVEQGGGSVTLCVDDCIHAHDEQCDDGGRGSDYGLCTLGSDCSDCGARYFLPSAAAPPSPSSISPPRAAASQRSPPPPHPPTPGPPPPPPVVALWLHAAVQRDETATYDEVVHDVGVAAAERAPEAMRLRYLPSYSPTNSDGDDDVPPSEQPLSVQHATVYPLRLGAPLELTRLAAAARTQLCAHAALTRECVVSAHLAAELDADTADGVLVKVTVRRSVHRGEALRAAELDVPPLRAALTSADGTAPPSIELGTPPATQDVLVKVDVAGWDELGSPDVSALRRALASALGVSSWRISAEAVHAREAANPSTAPGATVGDGPVLVPGGASSVGVAMSAENGEADDGDGDDLPFDRVAPTSRLLAPDFHVLLAGGLALAACLVITCCALFAWQIYAGRAAVADRGGKAATAFGSDAEAAEAGAMASAVEAHPSVIFSPRGAGKCKLAGVPPRGALKPGARVSRRFLPKVSARVLEMKPLALGKARASVNPVERGTVGSAALGPLGARNFAPARREPRPSNSQTLPPAPDPPIGLPPAVSEQPLTAPAQLARRSSSPQPEGTPAPQIVRPVARPNPFMPRKEQLSPTPGERLRS